MTDEIENNVNTFLDIAEKQLKSLEGKVKRCDILGIIDSYALISTNLQNAANWIPDLPPATRSEKMDKLHKIHDFKHKFVKAIPNICECKPKEPFRIVKELPKD